MQSSGLSGSECGSRGKFGTATYSASKAGLLGLAKSVAREAGRFGILINMIESGWMRTPLTAAAHQPIRDAALAETLVGSFVEPEVLVMLYRSCAVQVAGTSLDRSYESMADSFSVLPTFISVEHRAGRVHSRTTPSGLGHSQTVWDYVPYPYVVCF